MLHAIKDRVKSKAFKGAKGFKCPYCGADVIPKCGQEVIHHWAHASTEDCDTWSEGETDWHLNWKAYFPESWQEVTMGENNEHRADIKRPDGLVIEVQHSPITSTDAEEREVFYKNVIWIFDMHEHIHKPSILTHSGLLPLKMNGRVSSKLTLTDINTIIQRNKEFHSVNDPSELDSVVKMSSFNRYDNKDARYWWETLDDKQQRIDHCHGKIREWNNNLKRQAPWLKKLDNAKLEYSNLYDNDIYLNEHYPANDALYNTVVILDENVKALPLRLRWQNPKKAYFLRPVAFFWDYTENYLLYFPQVEGERERYPFVECFLVKKSIIIEILKD